jgi:prepilin-type N-terminal cleavage/methylation domain-containing protein
MQSRGGKKMINKIVRMLKQEQGFTLMELMIVVVILGILAAVAVPVYNGVQDRAKYAVGEANAMMLDRGAKQLVALGYIDSSGELKEFEDEEFDGTNPDHKEALSEFLDLTGTVEYVVWDEEDGFAVRIKLGEGEKYFTFD